MPTTVVQHNLCDGYNSRFHELSWNEIKELNNFAIKIVKDLDKDNLIIVADPLHCPTEVSLEFALEAEKKGADLISLIFREKFYSNEQVLEHFKFIDKKSGINVLIHEMPFISGLGGHTVNWPVELLDQLADYKSITAIKEDAKNDDYSKEVINTIKDRVSIVISGGGKRQWSNSLKLVAKIGLMELVYLSQIGYNFGKLGK